MQSLVMLMAASGAWQQPLAGAPAAAPPPVASSALMAMAVADTGHKRPRAVGYGNFYSVRLTIHRYASYATVPLFVVEYALGRSLYNTPPDSVSHSVRSAHGLVAVGIAGLFGINTVTGGWNLWDSRKDPAGRTRRYVHAALMLVSDAGFVATGALGAEPPAGAGGHDRPEPAQLASHCRDRIDECGPRGLPDDADLEELMVAPGLGTLVARWARLYADHKAVSGGVTYLHLAGILLGGGLAVSADRTVLRWSSGGKSDRAGELQTLGAVHRWVLAGLGLTFVSGIGMMLADLDSYLTSAVFWIKMSLIMLLVGNGYLKLRAEAAFAVGADSTVRRLRGTAVASLVLWFATLLAGTLLAAAT